MIELPLLLSIKADNNEIGIYVNVFVLCIYLLRF